MIFSPYIFFGHTWEINEKTMTALIERELFFKFFIRHSDLENSVDESLKGIKYYRQSNICRKRDHFVSLIITIHHFAKNQLNVKFQYTSEPDVFGSSFEKNGELILSNPLTLEEKATLHRLRQRRQGNVDHRTAMLESIDMDSHDDNMDLYTLRVPGIDPSENLVKYIFNVINAT